MSIYVDSSFLVSLYLSDVHSQDAESRLARRREIWLTPLHRAEVAHAISQHVFHGKISAQFGQQLYRDFEQHRRMGVWLEISLPESAFETCIRLAERHVPRLGVRTLDTLHVASALELGAERFWTFDVRQEKLAKAEGLKTS